MRNEAVAAHPNDVDRATTRLADLIARHVRTLLNAEEAEAGVARPAILKLIDSFGSNNRPKKEDEEKQ